MSILFYSIAGSAQNCKPTTSVTIKNCGSPLTKGSLRPPCNDWPAELMASDSNLAIISYVFAAYGIGFDEGVAEVFNTGAAANEAKKIIARVRRGTNIQISCIKAKDKKGNLYILQPLAFQF